MCRLRPASPPHSPSALLSPHTFSLSSHDYFPLFPLSFHPLMHCLFLGTNLTRFVFSQTFRAPPASRPRTATNGTVDASCSATNVCRPPPATAATTKRVCKRCNPPKDNPVARSTQLGRRLGGTDSRPGASHPRAMASVARRRLFADLPGIQPLG